MRKGLELAQLEAETKIRARYLRALEDERFDLLPADSYARGFLRLYADRLGLDSQLFVDEFTSRFSTGEEARLTRQPDSRRLVGRRLEAQIVLIALASIVAVTVLVIAAWRLGDSEPATQPTERPPPAAPAAAPPPAEAPPAAAPAPPPAPAVEPTEPAERAAPPEPVTATADPVHLVVTGVGKGSMVIVRKGSRRGKELFARRLRAGQTREYDATRLYVEVARPAGVEIVVDGREVLDVPAAPQGLVLGHDATDVVEPTLDADA
jgi:hypothetical protein